MRQTKPSLRVWWPAALFLIVVASQVSACRCAPTPPAPTPDVSNATVIAYHSPLHPEAEEEIQFEATASGRVTKLVLSYERFDLSTAPDGSHVQTLAQPLTTLVECATGAVEEALPCGVSSPGFPASSLVRFLATAFDDEGRGVTTSYSFAAGDYPWPGDPIPVRVNGDPGDHLDIVFIPDADIPLEEFQTELQDVVRMLYFKYAAIRDYQTLYNFYYSDQAGDYEETCSFTSPANMASLSLVADTIAILHRTQLRDCRSGNTMSSEIDYDKTLIHESGHALFDLRDEYCCDSSYSQQKCVPNIWSTEADCEQDAANLGYDAADCTQLTKGTDSVEFWSIDPAGSLGCMMGSGMHNPGSDFGNACLRRIRYRYGLCLAGNCYPWPECPGT